MRFAFPAFAAAPLARLRARLAGAGARAPEPLRRLLERRRNWTVPLRFKIVLLTVAALVVALGSSIYLGNRLFVEDKLSYIYDYNISHLRVTAELIERKIGDSARTVTALAAASSARKSPEARAQRAQALDRVLKERGRQPEIRCRRTLDALAALQAAGHVQPKTAAELTARDDSDDEDTRDFEDLLPPESPSGTGDSEA